MMITSVREASRFGSCNLLGELVAETSTRYIYRRRHTSQTAIVDKGSDPQARQLVGSGLQQGLAKALHLRIRDFAEVDPGGIGRPVVLTSRHEKLPLLGRGERATLLPQPPRRQAG